MNSLKEKIKELEVKLASRIEYNNSLDIKIAEREEEARKDKERIKELETKIIKVENSIAAKESILNSHLKDEIEDFISEENIVLDEIEKSPITRFNQRSVDELLADPNYEGKLDNETVGEIAERLYEKQSLEGTEEQDLDKVVNKNLKKKTLGQLKAARKSMANVSNMASSNVQVIDNLIEDRESKLKLSEEMKDEWFREAFGIEIPDCKLSLEQYSKHINIKFEKLSLEEKKFFMKWFYYMLPTKVKKLKWKRFPPQF